MSIFNKSKTLGQGGKDPAIIRNYLMGKLLDSGNDSLESRQVRAEVAIRFANIWNGENVAKKLQEVADGSGKQDNSNERLAAECIMVVAQHADMDFLKEIEPMLKNKLTLIFAGEKKLLGAQAKCALILAAKADVHLLESLEKKFVHDGAKSEEVGEWMKTPQAAGICERLMSRIERECPSISTDEARIRAKIAAGVVKYGSDRLVLAVEAALSG